MQDDIKEKFIEGLDREQPDWWISFADEQDKAHYIRESWTWEEKPASAEHLIRIRESLRRTVASRLMMAGRVGIKAWKV